MVTIRFMVAIGLKKPGDIVTLSQEGAAQLISQGVAILA